MFKVAHAFLANLWATRQSNHLSQRMSWKWPADHKGKAKKRKRSDQNRDISIIITSRKIFICITIKHTINRRIRLQPIRLPIGRCITSKGTLRNCEVFGEKEIYLIQFLGECGKNGICAVDARAGISSQMTCPREKGIVPNSSAASSLPVWWRKAGSRSSLSWVVPMKGHCGSVLDSP